VEKQRKNYELVAEEVFGKSLDVQVRDHFYEFVARIRAF
jgi:hypothetical protein